MRLSLSGLLIELRNRSELIRQRLRALASDDTHPANPLALHIYRTATQTTQAIARLLADPDLNEPALAKNYLVAYTRLAEEFHLAERKGMPVLERFNEDDRRLTTLLQRMATEHSIRGSEHLVVTATSSDYYWTMPPLGLIGVPATEAATLLGLPDLAHEVGHTLVTQDRAPVAEIEHAASIHFSMKYAEAAARGDPNALRYAVTERAWQNGWAVEFVCDAIAAYLLGPAFGFQHVRLAAEQTGDPWRPTLGEPSTHPADAPRARVIAAVLQIIGMAADAGDVASAWDDHVARQGRPRAGLHDACYPSDLLTAVAQEAVRFMQASGILDATTAVHRAGSVCNLLNNAWRRFLADPASYPDWERAQLPAA